MNDMTPEKAGRREWIALAVLALPTLLVSIDVYVLLLALPHLTADLGASSIEQLWITDIHGFLLAGFLITMGTLGDRIGRKKLLLIGAAGFGVASVVAACSTSPAMLIAARAGLGVAGAILAPSTISLIRTLFRDPKQMGLAIGLWGMCFSAGAVIGPVVGGAMLSQFWWGSVFLLGVPTMVLLLVVGPVLLPEYRDPNAGKLDLTSVALSLAAVMPTIYGLKELAKDGWRSTSAPGACCRWGFLGGGVLALTSCVLAAPEVGQLPAGHGDQPGERLVREAVLRPRAGGDEQRFLDRVLAQVELAVAADQRAEDLRRAAAQQVLDI
jgi:DHA2 family multidrug resistance protein-like MFS transporter